MDTNPKGLFKKKKLEVQTPQRSSADADPFCVSLRFVFFFVGSSIDRDAEKPKTSYVMIKRLFCGGLSLPLFPPSSHAIGHLTECHKNNFF